MRRHTHTHTERERERERGGERENTHTHTHTHTQYLLVIHVSSSNCQHPPLLINLTHPYVKLRTCDLVDSGDERHVEQDKGQ